MADRLNVATNMSLSTVRKVLNGPRSRALDRQSWKAFAASSSRTDPTSFRSACNVSNSRRWRASDASSSRASESGKGRLVRRTRWAKRASMSASMRSVFAN